MKTSLLANCTLAALVALAFAGCGPTPNAATPGSQLAAQTSTSTMPVATAQGQPYDYYILNLSWSPEFCFTHPTNPQCADHPGFVVHGLWPENNDGSYPQHCAARPRPTNNSVWQGTIPTADLAQHEWETHGTCTPYDADTYFGLIRRAFQSIKIPADFTGPTQPRMETPDAIIDAFSRINTGLPSGSIAVSCGNNYLTAVEVCFDKSLNPIACSGIRTCHANAVKITPR